jgi:hypothetical protein
MSIRPVTGARWRIIMRSLTLVAAVAAMACLGASPASASPGGGMAGPFPACAADAPARSPWSIDFGTPLPAAPPALLRYGAADGQNAPARRPLPVEYSEGYKTRAKIHKIASFATLPLFAANYIVGQDLYNHPGDESKKGLHAGLAATTGILFGVNTVTGAWNLWEGRKDPNHRKLRMTHGFLMMAADIGFLATAMLAPESGEHEIGPIYQDNASGRSTHRTVALTSMGIATVGYLIMLFGAR